MICGPGCRRKEPDVAADRPQPVVRAGLLGYRAPLPEPEPVLGGRLARRLGSDRETLETSTAETVSGGRRPDSRQGGLQTARAGSRYRTKWQQLTMIMRYDPIMRRIIKLAGLFCHKCQLASSLEYTFNNFIKVTPS